MSKPIPMPLIAAHGLLVAQVDQAAFLSTQGFSSTIVCRSRKEATIALAELHRAAHKPNLELLTLAWPVEYRCCSFVMTMLTYTNVAKLMVSAIEAMEEALADTEVAHA